MRAGGGGLAAAVTKMNVLPFFSRAEQRPFKVPVHVPAIITLHTIHTIQYILYILGNILEHHKGQRSKVKGQPGSSVWAEVRQWRSELCR